MASSAFARRRRCQPKNPGATGSLAEAIGARFAVRYVISGTAGERDGQIRLDAA